MPPIAILLVPTDAALALPMETELRLDAAASLPNATPDCPVPAALSPIAIAPTAPLAFAEEPIEIFDNPVTACALLPRATAFADVASALLPIATELVLVLVVLAPIAIAPVAPLAAALTPIAMFPVPTLALAEVPSEIALVELACALFPKALAFEAVASV